MNLRCLKKMYSSLNITSTHPMTCRSVQAGSVCNSWLLIGMVVSMCWIGGNKNVWIGASHILMKVVLETRCTSIVGPIYLDRRFTSCSSRMPLAPWIFRQTLSNAVAYHFHGLRIFLILNFLLRNIPFKNVFRDVYSPYMQAFKMVSESCVLVALKLTSR